MRDCTVLLQRALARDLATSRDAQAEAVRSTALVKTMGTGSGATTATGAASGSVGALGASSASG